MEQMVAEHKAAAASASLGHDQVMNEDDGSQSSRDSAEEGEGEEEEAQADNSDGEPADLKPPYTEGDPQELMQKAEG